MTRAATKPAVKSPVASSSNGRTAVDLRAVTVQVMADESVLREGGGAAGQARQKKLGRLTARERIAALIDEGSPWLETNLWAAWRMYPEVGEVPAAGVLTGIGFVHGRAVMVIANDATVKAGAFFPATCKKILRAQTTAVRCSLPLVYLVDSAGVYLPMQDEVFPDEDDFGRIFRNNAVISAMGIPQYSAVMGNCVAGGAYLPVLSDKLLMTADSELYLAGPALVRAAIGQQVDAAELGGAKMHAEISGTVDFYEPDDQHCIRRLRDLIDMLPAPEVSLLAHARLPSDSPPAEAGSPRDRSGHSTTSARPELDAQTLYDLVSPDGRKEYDVRDLLRAVVDAGTVNEYKADYGKTLVCAYARIAGRAVGVVASQRVRTKSAKGELQIGGVIYHDSADKAARFVMDCDQTGLPLVFIQDVTGFMVGRDSEQAGIIRAGAKLVNAMSNVRVPKITMIVGGSFGAGNYALCGKAFDPTLIFSWPSGKYAVMGAAQAANTLLQLERRQAERAGKEMNDASIAELRERITQSYESQTDIRYGAARGWVDAIIPPHETRNVLSLALDLATRPKPAGGFRGGVFQV